IPYVKTDSEWKVVAQLLSKYPSVFDALLDEGIIDPMVDNGILFNWSSLRNAIINNPNFASKVITIDSEQDIIDLSSKLTALGNNRLVYPINYIYDPRMMVKYGFLPSTIYPGSVTRDIIEYVDGMDDDTFIFWYGEAALDNIETVLNDVKWNFFTLETHKRNGITKAYSLPLLIYKDSYIYSDTKRPKTDMALFRQPASLKVKRDKIDKLDKVIEVTRYAEGMSCGLYQSESKTCEYCGTFYYYQPGSNTLLSYGKSVTYKNKYLAVKALDTHGWYANILTKLEGSQELMGFVNGDLPDDLVMTPDQILTYYRSRGLRWEGVIPD